MRYATVVVSVCASLFFCSLQRATARERGTPDAPPTIVARVTPFANAAGWHQTDVTVSFTCTDDVAVASCPDPVTVTTEGIGQVVSRTATDSLGQTAMASVTLKIDKTPPALAITSPTTGGSTAGTSQAVGGTVSDALSGLSTVRCNNMPTTIVAGALNCTAALGKGHNTVIAYARDVAGNSGSQSFTVTQTGTPTAMQITPDAATIVVGGTRTLTLVDDFGQTVTGATWAVDDDTIIELDTTDDVTVEGLAVGTTTVTATLGALTATATLTVATGTTLAAGATRWTITSFPGFYQIHLVQLEIDEQGAELYSIETDNAEGPSIVRGFDASGRQVSMRVLPFSGGASRAATDRAGGLILAYQGTLVRAAQSFGTSWQYAPSWQLSSFFAIGQDDSVYIVEQESLDRDQSLIALNGLTGNQRWRIRLPNTEGHALAGSCHFPSGPVSGATRALTTQPIVDTDGYVHVQVQWQHSVTQYSDPTCPSHVQDLRRVDLLSASPLGTPTWRVLGEGTYAGPQASYTNTIPTVGRIVPTDDGKVVATWVAEALPAQTVTEKISVVETGGVTTYNMPVAGTGIALDESGRLVIVTGTGVGTVDLSDGSTGWQA